MPHQDLPRVNGPAAHHQDLGAVLDWITDGVDLAGLTVRSHCSWSPRTLIAIALLWAWSDEPTLGERFLAARKIVLRAWGLPGSTAATSQAFLKRLQAWTGVLVAALVLAFRRRMQEDLAERFAVAGFAAFGVDGSRLQLPRTASNQGHFARPARRPAKAKSGRGNARAQAARRKKAEDPQMWLTTMFHLGTGLPWDWRLGPTDSSEREHLRQMSDALPAEALVVADAGFVGYDLWSTLRQGDRHLLVRVGSNVRLLKQLGDARVHDGLVWLWPDHAARRGQPPLVLRLIVAQGPRHPVYLVTSVLDEARLPDRAVVELYRLRWGIELFYRHFKQTFGRRKLRSQRAENAELEATWSLVGLWAMGLHGQVELSYDAIPASSISVSGLLRAYRSSLREYRSVPEPGESLWDRLRQAVIDPYRRSSKTSRDYPRKKHERAPGAPQILSATALDLQRAEELSDVHPEKLTA